MGRHSSERVFDFIQFGVRVPNCLKGVQEKKEEYGVETSIEMFILNMNNENVEW